MKMTVHKTIAVKHEPTLVLKAVFVHFNDSISVGEWV